MAKKDTRSKRNTQPKDEFEQRIIDLARVTRVMAGGKRLRFRVCMVIGDRNGRIGFGVAKGADVALAISKAVAHAKKDIMEVPLVNETIPHRTLVNFKSAQVLFKPAPVGTGIIAGGAVRQVLELAGVPNVVAKILGCNNKISNVKAVFKAFEQMKLVSGSRSKKVDARKIIKPVIEKKDDNNRRGGFKKTFTKKYTEKKPVEKKQEEKKTVKPEEKKDKVNVVGKEDVLVQDKK